MKSPKIRLGLLGVGKIANDQHLPAIHGNSRFSLDATASPEGNFTGVPAYPDFESLLAQGPALDAVTICTPPSVRSNLAKQALAAGLHVMLEKPPAATVAEVEEMALAAKAAQRSLFATWHSRETGAVDAAKLWLLSREVKRVTLIWREDVRVWHPGQDWLLEAGGFGVFDPAINALSILTHILPKPLSVDRAKLGIPQNRGAPMTANITLRHGDVSNIDCELSILHSGHQQWDIQVETDGGTLLLKEGGHRLSIDGTAHGVELGAENTALNNEYARLYARFAQLVDANESDLDARPLILVENALRQGEITELSPFDF